jgi:hypothetical protein
MTPKSKNKSIIYPLLVGIVFLSSILFKWNSPSFPYFHYDSGSFLFPALDFLNNGTISCFQDNRNFFYPLFLSILLKISYSLKTIPFVQHMLGLLSGFLLFKILSFFIEELKSGPITNIVAKAGSLIILTLYLFSHSVNLYEHYILAESLTGIVVLTTIYVCLNALRYEKNYWYGLSLFATCCVCYLQPRYILSCIVCLCILVYYLFKQNKEFLTRARIISVSVALVLLLLVLPNRIYKSNTPELYSGFIAASKADILCKQFNEDITGKEELLYDKELVKKISGHFSSMLTFTLFPEFPRVGFPIMIYFHSFPNQLIQLFDHDLKAMDRFFQYYIYRSMLFQTRLWATVGSRIKWWSQQRHFQSN